MRLLQEERILLIKLIDITNKELAEDVLRVQLVSYQVEAELIDCYEIPPLKDTVDKLRQCGEKFYGYYSDEVLGGVISFKEDNDLLDIHRLMVHPDYFRQGIAQMLLDFVEAENKDCETLIVSTGSSNAPAVRFYEKNGFVKTEEISLSEGILITSFKKTQ